MRSASTEGTVRHMVGCCMSRSRKIARDQSDTVVEARLMCTRLMHLLWQCVRFVVTVQMF